MSAENPPNLPVPVGPRGIVEKRDTLPDIGVTKLRDEELIPNIDEESVASPEIIDAEFSPIEYKESDGGSNESEAQVEPIEEERALERVRNALGLINESIPDAANDSENASSMNIPGKDEVIHLGDQSAVPHTETLQEAQVEGDPTRNHECKPHDHEKEHAHEAEHEDHDDHEEHHKHIHGKHDGHGHHESKPMGKKERAIAAGITAAAFIGAFGVGELMVAPAIVGWLGLGPVVSSALATAGWSAGFFGIGSLVLLSLMTNFGRALWEELKTNPPWKGIVKLGGGGGGGKKKSGGGGGHAPSGGDHH